MLKNLSFSKKWTATMLIVILLLSSVIFYLLNGLRQAEKTLENFVLEQYPIQTAVSSSRIHALLLARDIRDLFIETQAAGDLPETKEIQNTLQNIQKSKALLQQDMNLLTQLFELNKGKLTAYEETVFDWMEIGDTIVRDITSGNGMQAKILILGDCPKALNRLTEEAEKLGESIQMGMDEAVTQSTSDMHNLKRITLCIFFISLLLAAILSFKVRQSILRPLNEINTAALAMSQGSLHHNLQYSSKDELGQLADSMRQCTHFLDNYIKDINRLMQEVAKGNYQLKTAQKYIGDFAEIGISFNHLADSMVENVNLSNAIASQVADGASQVSASAQALAEGASEQAGTILEITKNLDNINQKTASNAKNAAIAASTAGGVTEEILQSADDLIEMTQAMAEINSSSNEINQITKTIEDIAFQTNLLALNAAVEAARSGAAGKGFSVVANEVRSLAEKSAEASKEIASLIEQLKLTVSNGTKIANATSESMNHIVESATEATDAIGLISKVSAQEAQLVEEISLAMEQISIVVQNNAAVAEESAAASQQLSAQAEMLKDMISQYKVRD